MANLPKKEFQHCPSCGFDLRHAKVYSFKPWATPAIITLLSLMLVAFDLVNSTISGELWNIAWSIWAIIGMWIFYITVQLLRFNSDYGWLLIPFGGLLFITFFILLDRSQGVNQGPLGLDWALNVTIPIFTFIVFLPILARIARAQSTHLDILEQFVDSLEDD